MELRLAFRRLRRSWMVSAAVVAAIALAVAVNTALFSVIDGLLFRPLPFPAPDQLVAVDAMDWRRTVSLLPDAAERRGALRERLEQSPLVATASQAGAATFFLPIDARDAGLHVEGVDARFLPLFGLSPALGAGFGRDDELTASPSSAPTQAPLPIIIGHDLWHRIYAATPDVLGSTRDLAGRTVRIVGIMPPGVKFPGETNVWAPVSSTRAMPPAYLRLAPGATLEQIAGAFPELRFASLRETLQPGRTRALAVLFVAAVALLIVTWVQVAALMFSRSLTQLQEIGVRLALGAERAHLARGFAIESAITATAALALAWLAARPLTMFLVARLPADLRDGQYLEPDLRTFLFSAAISLTGFLILTAVPLVVSRRAGLLGLLSGRIGDAPLSAERVRRGLLAAQMTLTALLVYLSGLAFHSFAQAVRFDYGFDVEHVLVFEAPPTWAVGKARPELKAAFAEHNRKIAESVESLQAEPGVVAAATFFSAPLGVGMARSGLGTIEQFNGRPVSDIQVRANSVGADFVRAFGARLIAGRPFTDPAHAGQDNLVIINETLARRLMPPSDEQDGALLPAIVGRVIVSVGRPLRVVGVIDDLVDTAPEIPPDPQLFLCERAAYGVAIRVDTSTGRAVPMIQTALERIWGPLPPRQITLMRNELDRVLLPYRAQSVVLGAIAACCLPIAAIGLMGALTHAVRTRTREIAIRIAMGAEPAAIRRGVVRSALATVAVGILVGTSLGALAGRVVAHQLLNVRAADPITMGLVTAALLGLGYLAAILPARSASRVQPAEALRQV